MSEIAEQRAQELKKEGMDKYLSEIDISLNQGFDDVLISAGLRDRLDEFVKEQQHGRKLFEYGLLPRNKMLICGAHGNGKKELAKAVALEVAAPLFEVNIGALISNYTGDMYSRIEKVFTYARAQEHCVLLFDATGQQGIIERAAHLIEHRLLYCTVLIILAKEMYDIAPGLAKMMDMYVYMPKPEEGDKEKFLKRLAKGARLNFGIAEKELASRLKVSSYESVQNFYLDVLRHATLEGCRENAKEITLKKLEQWGEKKKA